MLTDREYEALYGTSRRSAGAYEDSNYHEMEGRPDGGRSSYATLRSDDLPRSRRTSGGRYHTLQRGENGDRPYEDAPVRHGGVAGWREESQSPSLPATEPRLPLVRAGEGGGQLRQGGQHGH